MSEEELKRIATERFIRETNQITAALKGYAKSSKTKPDDIKVLWFWLSRLIQRTKGRCDKEIMHQQGIKVIREFKRFDSLVPELKPLPEVPEEPGDEER